VPSKGLEPPHPCGYMDLNHARLPIPPRWQKVLRGDPLGPACQERTTSNILQGHRWLSNIVDDDGPHMKTDSSKLPDDVRGHLRALTHDLSNAVEIMLQAAYLLQEANLDADTKKWTQLIEKAADDAARINYEIRETLRSQE
jgi:hypothetical protein